MRVGLMVPANIPRGDGLLTKDTIPAYVDRAIALARDHFAGGAVDVIAYGCTAAGFLSGPAGDADLAERLSQATLAPVITTARAMVNALQYDKAKRVAVVTPYSDSINTQLTAFLESGDIEVVRLNSFRAPDVAALGRITVEEVGNLARETMGPDCDALFIGCSQLPTRAILAGLETEFSRPAWSSIRATAWEAMRVPVVQ
jgi:maleate cis-trans isomerase